MKTKVLFKIFKSECIALFPEFEESNDCILSYMHNGQHSAAHKNLKYCINATDEQKKDLENELKSIGYEF